MMSTTSLAGAFQHPHVSRNSSPPLRRTAESQRQHLRLCAAAAILLASALSCVRPASGQIDIVMKIDGIRGESRVDKHEEEIDVISVGMGASQSGTFSGGGGGGTGKANFQDISLVKFVDKATPELLLALATGKHILKVQIDFIASGDKPKTFYSIELEKVLVSSVTAGAKQTDSRLSEAVSLNYGKIKISYVECDRNGAPKGTTVFAWDVEQNVKP